MRKYKINRTKEVKLPSAETIAKYKNYRRLRHEYDRLVKRPKKPLYRDRKLFLVLLLIVLIAYLVSQAINEDEEKKSEDPPTGQSR